MTRCDGSRRKNTSLFVRLGVEACEQRLALAADSRDEGGMIALELDVMAVGHAWVIRMTEGGAGQWSLSADERGSDDIHRLVVIRRPFSDAVSVLRSEASAISAPAVLAVRVDAPDFLALSMGANGTHGSSKVGGADVWFDEAASTNGQSSGAVADPAAMGMAATHERTRAGFDPLLFQASSLASQPMAAALRTVTLSGRSSRRWTEKQGRIEPLAIVDHRATNESEGHGTLHAAAPPGGLIDVQAAMDQATRPPLRVIQASVAATVSPPTVSRGRAAMVTIADTDSLVRAVVSWQPDSRVDGDTVDSFRGTTTSSRAVDVETPHEYLTPPPQTEPGEPADDGGRESWAVSASVAAMLFWASRHLQARLPDPQQPAAGDVQFVRGKKAGRSSPEIGRA